MLSAISSVAIFCIPNLTYAKLADRGRMVNYRNDHFSVIKLLNSRVSGKYTNLAREELPIEGPRYRGKNRWEAESSNQMRASKSNLRGFSEAEENFERQLGSQLTGCCNDYTTYSADNLCYKYGENCATGQMPSHDSGDDECEMDGLSFIGVSFSVNTANGSPYSYQLCDQFPMENIIDRDYDYVMSMDEDGWLVGGGYKSFDYSGKMPYIDSSHTELLRIGSLDPDYG